MTNVGAVGGGFRSHPPPPKVTGATSTNITTDPFAAQATSDDKLTAGFIEAFSGSRNVGIQHASRGDCLLRAGESPRSVAPITRGQIHLRRVVGGRPVILSLLGRGDTIGDVAVVTSTASSCDAVADTTVLVVSASEFLFRLQHNQRLAQRCVTLTTRRPLSSTNG
jgi:CRP-like cAMP-binding protein